MTSPVRNIYYSYRRRKARLYQKILYNYFNRLVGNSEFSIISNDCWGGEVYKVLRRPFNTPFIGLMIMGPCYITLLENLNRSLKLPLVFKFESKYPERQQKNAGIAYPLAVLGDTGIEIHFLHYGSESMAREKWIRRLERLSWEHLFIKYDCGKDYGDASTADRFIRLPYSNKLLIGKENFGREQVIVIKKYDKDATIQFRNSFLSFNPFGWLVHEPLIKNWFQKVICKKAAIYL